MAKKRNTKKLRKAEKIIQKKNINLYPDVTNILQKF